MERDRLTASGRWVVAFAFLAPLAAPLAFVAIVGTAQHMGWRPTVTTRANLEDLFVIAWLLLGVGSVVLLVRGVGGVPGRLRSLLVVWNLLPLLLALVSMCIPKS